ncbi:MAG TPA: hypothetical protein VK158_03670 [Acidobacteriota bacterium]|nr:hypothetical protein [Acidobacteriota bacterium]
MREDIANNFSNGVYARTLAHLLENHRPTRFWSGVHIQSLNAKAHTSIVHFSLYYKTMSIADMMTDKRLLVNTVVHNGDRISIEANDQKGYLVQRPDGQIFADYGRAEDPMNGLLDMDVARNLAKALVAIQNCDYEKFMPVTRVN